MEGVDWDRQFCVSHTTDFRVTNSGLKVGVFAVTKCKGQVCMAAKMANSFKEKPPESVGLSHATAVV